MERARQRQFDHPQSMVDLFPVNLEYLQFVDLDDPVQRQRVDRTIDLELQHLTGSHRLVVGTILWEHNTSPKVQTNIEYFDRKCQKLGIPVHFLLGLEKKPILRNLSNCTFIDFCLLLARYHGARQLINDQWQPDNKKFLFLMGKAYKPHRIGLLHRFYKQGMLTADRAIWSLHKGTSAETVKKHAPDATAAEIQDMLDNYKQSPDEVSPINNHYLGFPFDHTLYKNTNLSVVSETLTRVPQNTEKIYRAMINNHPFVIAGATGHSRYLKDMGFETFDRFFAVPDYDSITDLNSRLDAVVTNVKHFDSSFGQIPFLIEKNIQRLNELASYYNDNIDQALDTDSWQDFLFQDNNPYCLTWQYYYQTIKDPSWPECATMADCANLPQQIKQELSTVFKLAW
jgi:hypothetical protein